MQTVDRVGSSIRKVERGHFRDMTVEVATMSGSCDLATTEVDRRKHHHSFRDFGVGLLSRMTLAFVMTRPTRNRLTNSSTGCVLTRFTT